jgi:hypothetical protein
VTGDDREGLRRRLYRPGADPLDVAAYLALREPEPDEVVAAAPARRVRRWPTAVVGALAVLVLLAVVRAPSGDEHAGAGPTPLPTATVDPVTRAAFARRVAARQDAGLATWWEPGAPFVEEHGIGRRTVDLPPPSGSGRITVLLVLGADAVAGWSVEHLVIHDDRTIHLAVVGAAAGRLRAGVPAVGRVAFTPLTRPSRLLVDAPAGIRWGVTAVYSG